jgi:hypothetical protein
MIRTALRAVELKAALAGYSPGEDMTHSVPSPVVVKGVSSYYNREGELTGQWVKTKLDDVRAEEAIRAFIAGLAGALAADGLLILSTPNRTALSRIGLITVAEGLGQIPRGTHDWNKFLTPDELTVLVEGAGLRVTDIRGLSFSPAKGFVVGDDSKLNYLMTAVRG